MTAEEAEDRARDQVLFDDEPILDRDEIVKTEVVWVDDMNVQHLEGCAGKHCTHYGCTIPDDGVPWYCVTCDPASYG